MQGRIERYGQTIQMSPGAPQTKGEKLVTIGNNDTQIQAIPKPYRPLHTKGERKFKSYLLIQEL